MNEHEEAVKDFLEESGFLVFYKGWPDFMVVSRDNRGSIVRSFCVEAKHGNGKVTKDQVAMHDILRELGINVYIAREDFQDVIDCGDEFYMLSSHKQEKMEEIRDLEESIKILQMKYEALKIEVQGKPSLFR